ncbi:uncharacterized protein F4807DRAFT_343410 [Annulohypoxylon truncatum]|uniref:uncharacterized protein n=1 Tax=Annulohypoxylon truncatum TaxID=327061 RepID=UPI002007A7FF|nr:uncharacterized protein F4807DRAFT_343410 [Annulohypoxylon truncatum]KAI1212633.1 hypothetical protein F4807DRAFT_343410 [Annulohypoxylon truncatum]
MVRIARRSHKKSRAGCSVCKSRHIKCDEGRPACGNCKISSRYCSFLTSDSHLPTVSEDSTSSPTPGFPTRQLDASPSPLRYSPPSPSQELPCPNIAVANMVHMELFHHFMYSNLFDLPPPYDDSDKKIAPLITEVALSYPFLLNEVLAFSALHLSYVQPSNAQLYRHYAIGLQTHALGIFNGEMIEVNRDNCMAILLFSWLLTLHSLIETVDSAGSADIHSLLDRFVHCMQLHLGVRAVKTEAWHMMLESEMGFGLEAITSMMEYANPGSHTADLKSCIQNSKTLNNDEKSTCIRALDNIQWFLSSIDGTEKNGSSLVTAILSLISWPAKINVEFHQLIADRTPEALLALSYYAIPLHLCRESWIVRNAGQLLLQSIRVHLPDEWHRWLDWPEEMMERISAGV